MVIHFGGPCRKGDVFGGGSIPKGFLGGWVRRPDPNNVAKGKITSKRDQCGLGGGHPGKCMGGGGRGLEDRTTRTGTGSQLAINTTNAKTTKKFARNAGGVAGGLF